MRKSYKDSLVVMILFLAFASNAGAVLNSDRKQNDSRKQYLRIHKKFSRQACSGGIEQGFWRKNKEYSKNKYHLPVLLDGKLDKKVIKEYLPLIKKKSEWIKENQNHIIKANFKRLRKELRTLRKGVGTLLRYKQQYFDGKDSREKKNIVKKSKKYRIKYARRLSKYFEKISFLLSFHFPVNHLGFRKQYDSLKYLQTQEHKEKANRVYFYRKIVEDGAQDPSHKANDIFLRTTIDTIFLGINKNIDFITEELRYDMKFIFAGIDSHLRKGKKRQSKRLKEWHDRVVRKYDYYAKIINDETGEIVLSKKRTAHTRLRDFVLKKQAETYSFWNKQSELMQAIFAIETILFNEVGGIDGPDALERRDITQVVINRRSMSEYTKIGINDSVYSYLKDQENYDNPWLNLLLKEGEFSFSYFFIPATVRIFCPAMTKRARKLRKQNVSMALNMLEKPNSDFKAIRYFSRASMLGRIDMSSIWDNFVPIPERPGLRLKSSKLRRRYIKGDYSYLYHFSDNDNYLYKVISVNNKNYVVDPRTRFFYKYRNPHVFKYFSAIE